MVCQVTINKGSSGNRSYIAVWGSNSSVFMSLDYMVEITSGTKSFSGKDFQKLPGTNAKKMTIIDGTIYQYANVSSIRIVAESNSQGKIKYKYENESVEKVNLNGDNTINFDIGKKIEYLTIEFNGWGNLKINDFIVTLKSSSLGLFVSPMSFLFKPMIESPSSEDGSSSTEPNENDEEETIINNGVILLTEPKLDNELDIVTEELGDDIVPIPSLEEISEVESEINDSTLETE